MKHMSYGNYNFSVAVQIFPNSKSVRSRFCGNASRVWRVWLIFLERARRGERRSWWWIQFQPPGEWEPTRRSWWILGEWEQLVQLKTLLQTCNCTKSKNWLFEKIIIVGEHCFESWVGTQVERTKCGSNWINCIRHIRHIKIGKFNPLSNIGTGQQQKLQNL